MSKDHVRGCPASPLQSLMLNNNLPNGSAHSPQAHQLALQVAHNLRFQHNWSDIRVHYDQTLPRPMISGMPPNRLYLHPDEQIEILQRQRAAGKSGLPDLENEREWVLPSHLREPWTLRRLADVFDNISLVPPDDLGIDPFQYVQKPDTSLLSNLSHPGIFDELVAANSPDSEPKSWRLRQPKRLVLATLDDDSTIVYYIVHDGIVKPRQN